MFCLDTNVVIGILNGRKPVWIDRIARELVIGTPVVLPVGVHYELLYDAAKSDRPERSRANVDDFLAGGVTVASFTPDDAAEAGAIRADLERRGLPIGPIDVLIAAQVRRLGAVLVTDNRREFERVTGLMVTDWA
jgi:tRNA(fMet)-specific endonuclease VapC